MDGDVTTKAPAPDAVKVEAIGAKCEDYQVRALLVLAGADASTLVASGRVQGATHVRLTVMHGEHARTRSGPVLAS
jgi:hypothetical protein